MNNGHQILRSYSLLSSLKENIPDTFEISETWVKEYHEAIDKLEAATGLGLQEFRVPHECLYRSVSSYNYLSHETTYRKGLWCERSILMHKLMAVLTYFTGLQSDQDKRIGFNQ